MRLAFVENEADRLKHIKTACEQHNIDLLGGDVFPFPVNARNYSKWIGAVRAYRGELVIVLDLNLEVDRTLDELCRELSIDSSEQTAIQSNHGHQYWQGFLLAREAIKNESIRPLVIAIASTVESPQAKIRFLKNYVAACTDQSVSIFQGGEAIEGIDEANRCLGLVVREWAAAFPSHVGNLGGVDWNSLRQQALELCRSKSSQFGHIYWPHHAPHVKYAYTEQPNPYTEAVEWARERLLPKFPQVVNLPLYSWPKLTEELKPPFRSILAFDSAACDLSAAVYAIDASLSGIVGPKVDVFVTIQTAIGPAGGLKHDYLWFNVVAVSNGLGKLLAGFNHLFDEKHKRETTSETVSRGEFTATFLEHRTGIRLTVSQRFTYWHSSVGSCESDYPIERFRVEWVPFPRPDYAQKIVAQAYRDFGLADATVEVDQNGVLCADIDAEMESTAEEDVFWRVKSRSA